MAGLLNGREALAKPKLLSLEIWEAVMDEQSDCWWWSLLALGFE